MYNHIKIHTYESFCIPESSHLQQPAAGCIIVGMKVYDIYLFLGQSNMAGRGISTEEFPETYPKVTEGAGYEYRAVTRPGVLTPITEPFGVEENREDGINDRWGDVRAKTGSMVSSFVNTYYDLTGTPVIGLSASKGGSTLREWLPGSPYFSDLMGRIDSMMECIARKAIKVRNMSILFCQGESDADRETDNYTELFNIIWKELKRKGFETLFMIPIGRMNAEGKYHRYDRIRDEQYRIIESDEHVMLASQLLVDMLDRGLMKDEFHYFQQAYNEVGRDAAINVARYLYGR